MRPLVKHFLIGAVLFMVFFAGPGIQKGSAKEALPAGYLGVRLQPVPEMLAVHLGLEPDKGQIIVNIVVNSPADVASLVRYDIITAIDGEKVADYESFVEKIQSAGSGTEVKLTVISSGKEKNVKVKLAAPPQDELAWKYENILPGSEQHPGPGAKGLGKRRYRFDPFKQDDWPQGLDDIYRFFHREYRFGLEPNDSRLIPLPDEQTNQRLQELEKRLDRLEEQQQQILERLNTLLEKD